jgi:ADP-ribose pyrophosphatase
MTEVWLNSIYKHKGKVFSLRTGDVRLDDGQIVQRDVIEHPGGVAVVPILDDKTVILLRQFRISVGKEIIELPGGRVEIGEPPEVTAARELVEETGYEAGNLIDSVTFLPAPGFTNLRIHIYLAWNLNKTNQQLEWDEKPELLYIPISQVRKSLANGEFEDGNTVIGLLKLMEFLENNPI